MISECNRYIRRGKILLLFISILYFTIRYRYWTCSEIPQEKYKFIVLVRIGKIKLFSSILMSYRAAFLNLWKARTTSGKH